MFPALIILIFVILILVVLIIVGAFQLIFDIFLELPYVGANKKRIKTIIELAQIKKGSTVVDLGSGDGRLLFAAANFEAYAIGYEINPLLVAITKFKISLKKNNNVEVKKDSLWKADLKKADIIFVYALRKSMAKFENFIYKNAKKGTKIIVNTNPFPNKKPKKQKDGIFLYIV